MFARLRARLKKRRELLRFARQAGFSRKDREKAAAIATFYVLPRELDDDGPPT